MPKSLFQRPNEAGEYRCSLDLSDKDAEHSFSIPPYAYATVQAVLRGTIGNITVKAQVSNDGVNSSAFSSAVTFTASGHSTSRTVGGYGFMHILNESSGGVLSTGSGWMDVFVQLHRQDI